MKPETRLNYGRLNFGGAGAPDRWTVLEDALRGANMLGATYRMTAPWPATASGRRPLTWYDPQATGGVRAGDVGLLPSERPGWSGIFRGYYSPQYPEEQQTLLWQRTETPFSYQGDAPVVLQPQVRRPAPWRR
jgi:hypothetical protein